MNRRAALAAMTSAMTLVSVGANGQSGGRRSAVTRDAVAALAALERASGGRLGVAMLDTGSGAIAGHRLDERFALCSTFKLLLAGAILEAIAVGRIARGETVRFGAADIVANSPVTRENLPTGAMTVEALARATQTTSDNAAANLLLPLIGGPAGLTAALRRWGDLATRIDRIEPAMNLVAPGDPRDTTTPRAMAQSLRRLALGPVLPARARDTLLGWMVETRTGLKRLRAGFPQDWRAGDKTGTMIGGPVTDKFNDVAIAWPAGRPPLIVACYFDSARITEAIADADQRVLARVGAIAAQWAGATGRRLSAEFSHIPLA